jgi:hypothetical protein
MQSFGLITSYTSPELSAAFERIVPLNRNQTQNTSADLYMSSRSVTISWIERSCLSPVSNPALQMSQSSSSKKYVEPSTNSYYTSYGGWQNFMHSYGLKPWDLDDVEEGKRIVQAFKDADREQWEEEQKEKAEAAGKK